MTSKDWFPIGSKTPASDIPDVFIALPTYSQVMCEFAASLMALLGRVRCKIQFHGGDSLVTRARNNVTHDFLRTQIPWLLFIDTDLVFSPECILHLLSHGPSVPIVGGCYPRKKPGPAEWILNGLPNTSPDPKTGLQEVYEIGTGMLLVHRSVFGAMKEAYPHLRYRCDGNKDIRWDFFPVGTWRGPEAKDGEEARYLSEDWYFCQLARAIGYRIYADTKCWSKHIGMVAYPFPDQDQIKEAPALTATERPMVREVQIFGEAA